MTLEEKWLEQVERGWDRFGTPPTREAVLARGVSMPDLILKEIAGVYFYTKLLSPGGFRSALLWACELAWLTISRWRDHGNIS